MPPTTAPASSSLLTIQNVASIFAIILGIVNLVFFSISQLSLAKKQAAIAVHRLKMDLYEKRFKVFEATWEFIFAMIQHGKIRNEDRISFNRNTYQKMFLFESDVCDFLNSLGTRAQTACFPQNLDTNPDVAIQLVKEQTNIHAIFNRYLDIHDIDPHPNWSEKFLALAKIGSDKFVNLINKIESTNKEV